MRTPPASARRASAKQRAKRAARQERSAIRTGAGADAGEPPPAGVTGRNTHTLGRTRDRSPDSAARAPMAVTSARAVKRTGARTFPAGIPAFIRATGAGVDAGDKAYLRRKPGRRLRKFASQVQRVSVRLDDVNGPRGGVDQRCRIKVTLRDQPSVMVERLEPSLHAAMDRSLSIVGTAVRRALQQRRAILHKPGREGHRVRAIG